MVKQIYERNIYFLGECFYSHSLMYSCRIDVVDVRFPNLLSHKRENNITRLAFDSMIWNKCVWMVAKPLTAISKQIVW